MQRTILLAFAALFTGTAYGQTPSLFTNLISPEKAVPVLSQSLSGTWLSELRRPGPSGLLPPIPTIVTFSSEGVWISAPADGTQTATQGVWIRVGDRRFLGSGYFFVFNESRVLTTVTKLRINYQLSEDGKTLNGTTEAVILSPDGTVLNTLTGATFSMVRLSPEMPADFQDFQKLP